MATRRCAGAGAGRKQRPGRQVPGSPRRGGALAPSLPRSGPVAAAWRPSCSSPTRRRAATGCSVFRLGNMVHAIVAARQTIQLPDPIPRICLTASNLTRALYFICDTVLWLKSVGLLPHIYKWKWRSWATKCYYYSLLMNLTRDLYEISWLLEQAAEKEKAKENSFPWDTQDQDLICLETERRSQPFLLLLCCTLKKHPPLLLDTAKNLCDLSSPLDRLGIYKTNPGIIGLCGLLSSLVGILTIARPHLKLK
ncbi:PREDICTED: peroxisomal membrane protein 11A isoform X1 [Crocodylus porosus]|uniref:peroxisomal membrane protein 11A isoform X1 n=1 Tax=Crocodylus porosus TaxID=8502 RepID=UPI00093D5ED4|nr:PREDICTED: peroxisomal membrane protein 11A isoform X1 [Crocodylus porosus]